MIIEHSPSLFPAAGLAGALLLCGSLATAAGVELPVPNVTIYPGDMIGDTLLVDRTFQLKPGEDLPVYKQRDGLIGKVARRTLPSGRPIPLNSVREADLVSQGKPVTIIFQAGGLTISGQAIALTGGRVGDLLSLRNIDSGAVIKGIVQADGTVRVSGR
jgi:flagellar basal body P-ring formation protein FlgA